LIKKFKLSVFQGRHVAEGKKNIQVFPKKTWTKEINLIKKNNFKFFHWVLGRELLSNPLIMQKKKVKKILEKFDIKILAICCDYFMFNSILDNKTNFFKILNRIVLSCKFFGIRYIEIPFFKDNVLQDKNQIIEISNLLNSIINKKKFKKIKFCIESNLNIKQYIFLINKIKNKSAIKIVYDTGNSYKLDKNKNFFEEASKLKKYIHFIHIKDADYKSWTTKFGTGNVNFKRILVVLKKINYKGYLVLQTAREKNDVSEIRRNLRLLRRLGYNFK
jgi:sugar phosphate isomerase/epimerase